MPFSEKNISVPVNCKGFGVLKGTQNFESFLKELLHLSSSDCDSTLTCPGTEVTRVVEHFDVRF